MSETTTLTICSVLFATLCSANLSADTIPQRIDTATPIQEKVIVLHAAFDPRPNDKCGFVFIDNSFLPPPYTITAQGDRLMANEHVLPYPDLHAECFPTGLASDSNDGTETSHLDQASLQIASLQARIEYAIIMGKVVVINRRQPPLFLDQANEGQQLISAITTRDAKKLTNKDAPAALSKDQYKTWEKFVSTFRPTPEFLSRAHEHLRVLNAVQHANMRLSLANVWVSRMGYGMTVFAMIAVVLGFGHLLSNRPCAEDDAAYEEPEHAARRIVGRSLQIVAMLAIADIAWTIAASSAGSMRELNPLGSRIIDNPIHLLAFKIAVTSFAIMVLYVLRENKFAQRASWWSCLVLTLLTARWLTFNSMFL